MSQAIPAQHPAVVLRSHYLQMRRLLAIACIAIVGLTVAVVAVATSNNGSTSIQRSANPTAQTDANPYSYNGGHEEGHLGTTTSGAVSTVRYDGGPEEGTRGPGH